jgi:hypothetical protein
VAKHYGEAVDKIMEEDLKFERYQFCLPKDIVISHGAASKLQLIALYLFIQNLCVI